MAVLPALAVVFVGIAGPDSARVDQQVRLLLQEQEVELGHLDPRRVRAIAKHDETSRALVRAMHVDGVVGGELVPDHGHHTLRVVVYSGEGAMKSLFEVPVSGRQLSRDEVAMLQANLADDIASLVHAAPPPAKIVAPPPKVPAAPPAPTPAKAAPPPAKVDTTVDPAEIEMEAPAPAEPAHEAAPVTDAAADEVTADDMLAATSATEHAEAEPAAPESTLRIGAAAGIAITGRNFAPAPSTVASYASAPVAAVHLDAHVQPTAHLALGVGLDRTLQMTTDVAEGAASTTMSRWEATASYRIDRGRLHVAPLVGVGRRAFSIVSNDPSRAPDSSYDYVIAGAAGGLELGRIALRGHLAVEPVVGGEEPTEMLLGEATRWAIDVGAAVEVRARAHLYVRAAADYQRFTWSWKMAGARGAGGAVDHYPSGTLSLGVEY